MHIELNVPEGDVTSVRKRRAVYFQDVLSFGVPNRSILRADWEEFHVPYSPNYGTLIGEEVYIEARSLEPALTLLLEELRTPQNPPWRQQQDRDHVISDVNEALESEPRGYELVGFEQTPAQHPVEEKIHRDGLRAGRLKRTRDALFRRGRS